MKSVRTYSRGKLFIEPVAIDNESGGRSDVDEEEEEEEEDDDNDDDDDYGGDAVDSEDNYLFIC